MKHPILLLVLVTAGLAAAATGAQALPYPADASAGITAAAASGVSAYTAVVSEATAALLGGLATLVLLRRRLPLLRSAGPR